ncbi:MAG: LacI family DNA-binding transcriptional regulator, partial [Eubacteriales bacterium]
MASIHDVAKMAQVSTATVSKHLNKAGYVSPEKREAIDQAVATLGYAINRNARMLKTKQSSDILFIVPNMLERIYREMAESTTSILGEEYRVIIQLSQDNPHRERKILQECLNNPCAGILLVTCIPEDTQLLLRVRSQIPMIFLHRQPQDLTNCSFFGFNHFDTIYGLASELYRLGHHDIGLFVGDSKFSCEQECIRGFAAMLQSKGIGAPANRIFSAPLNKDTTFRSVMRLFDSGDYPKVFLCSSTLTAQAINDVAYFRRLDIGRDLFVFALGEDSWYNSIFVNRIISTYRDARKIGSLAATSLKELIQSPLIYEPLHVELNDEFAIHWINRFLQRLEANATIRPKLQPTCSLKIAFNAGDAGADALRSLISQYANQHQVKVELDILPHHQLHETIVDMAERKSADYDLFAVDAPWLSHLHSMGVVHDLTDLATPTDILTN